MFKEKVVLQVSKGQILEAHSPERNGGTADPLDVHTATILLEH